MPPGDAMSRSDFRVNVVILLVMSISFPILNQKNASHRNPVDQIFHQKYPVRQLPSNAVAMFLVSIYEETICYSNPPWVGRFCRGSDACALRGLVVEKKQHPPLWTYCSWGRNRFCATKEEDLEIQAWFTQSKLLLPNLWKASPTFLRICRKYSRKKMTIESLHYWQLYALHHWEAWFCL